LELGEEAALGGGVGEVAGAAARGVGSADAADAEGEGREDRAQGGGEGLCLGGEGGVLGEEVVDVVDEGGVEGLLGGEDWGAACLGEAVGVAGEGVVLVGDAVVERAALGVNGGERGEEGVRFGSRGEEGELLLEVEEAQGGRGEGRHEEAKARVGGLQAQRER
jgi:hypothetical protein